MPKKVNFDITGAKVKLSEVNDDQFSMLKIRAFSDSITSHGYKCSKKTLKKCAYTLLEKPILVYYNKYASMGKPDFEGHEDGPIKQEIPCGFIPKNSEIEFETEDGVTYAVVYAYIWKMYFEHIMEVFKRDDMKKDVSVELLILESTEQDGYTEMTDFCFTGITLLGEAVSPACKGAYSEVVKFSDTVTTEYEKAKEEFEKKLYCSVNQGPSGSFFNITNQEVTMENEKLNNSSAPDKVDNATQIVTTTQKVETHVDKYDDNHNYAGSEHEEHKTESTTIKEVASTGTVANADPTDVECAEASENSSETIDNACKDKNSDHDTAENSTDSDTSVSNSDTQDNSQKEDNSCKQKNGEGVDNSTDTQDFEKKCYALEERCTSFESELANANLQIQALQLKCAELEVYKNNKENELKKQAIEFALSEVSNVLNTEQIDEWRDKAIGFSDVDSFKNQLKAFAFDVQSKKGITTPESMRNVIPKEFSETEPEDIWDRLEKKYAI